MIRSRHPDNLRSRVTNGRVGGGQANGLLLLLTVAFLTLVPVIGVLWGSLRSGPPGVPSTFSLDNYRQLFESPGVVASLGSTIHFAGGATLLAVAIGTYLAWLAERTEIPGRRAIYVLALVPLFVPGVLTTVAWSLTLGSEIGVANLALSTLMGREVAVFDGHTMLAMIWADGSDSFTLPFLLMVAAFRMMDPGLEEASEIAGAGRLRTVCQITLPLTAPALASATLLVFVNTVDSLQVPAILGLPAGIRVLATEVYLSARTSPVDMNLAATWSAVYLVIALLALFAYWRLMAGNGRFVTVTGRGYRPARTRLGASRLVHAWVAFGVLFLAVVVPLLVMLYTSFLTYYRPPSMEVWSELTLRNYRRVLSESEVVPRALLNNLTAGGWAALATMLLGSASAWFVARTHHRRGRALDALATAPIAFPGLMIAVALMWFYLYVPLPIYATLTIIAIGYTTAFLPFVHRAADAALAQVSPQLEEASAVSGASRSRTFVRIVLPLIGPGVLAAGIYVLSRTLRALSLPILLAGVGNEVLPVLVYQLYEGGRFPELNALGMLMVLLLILIGVLAAGAARFAPGSEPHRRSSTTPDPMARSTS